MLPDDVCDVVCDVVVVVIVVVVVVDDVILKYNRRSRLLYSNVEDAGPFAPTVNSERSLFVSVMISYPNGREMDACPRDDAPDRISNEAWRALPSH